MKSRKPEGPRKPARNSAKPRTAFAATKKAGRPKPSGETPLPPSAANAKQPAITARTKIPPILLEGDLPAAPPASVPGQRYSVGPSAIPQTPAIAAPAVGTPAIRAPAIGTPAVGMPAIVEVAAELPESYGTGELLLTARDPHWLYAHWDYTRSQIKHYNGLSADGHLMLRVYGGAVGGELMAEIHVHPESRTWFVPVPYAEAKYVGELGYREASHSWVSLARSGATMTPPESFSEDTSARFATIPVEIPLAQLLSTVKSAVGQHGPLIEAIQQMRTRGYAGLPAPEEIAREWTPAQEKALAEAVSIDLRRRVWIGSLEITELVRRQIQEERSSQAAAQFGLSQSAAGESGVSSASVPFGGGEGGRGFWFNVNAELVVYGATEPDAKVTIGGRPVRLRADGSFSFRFALPDGEYYLPATAQSGDGEETRQAWLKFARATIYEGEVRAHPQDGELKPPSVNAIT